MNLHRNTSGQQGGNLPRRQPEPSADEQMDPEELQKEYFASVFASCDALEQMAFIQEVTALKAGIIQIEDCEYTEAVGGHFRRKHSEA